MLCIHLVCTAVNYISILIGGLYVEARRNSVMELSKLLLIYTTTTICTRTHNIVGACAE